MPDELGQIHRALHAANTLLDRLGITVAKSFDLATATGFDGAVVALAAELRRRAAEPEAAAVRAAVHVLDIDWRRTTANERRRLVGAALTAAGRRTALIPTQIHAPLSEAAERVVAATRAHARREQGLAIAADFNAVDRRAIAHVTRSTGNFVRDAYGRRLDMFGQRAREVVADGLERGLGRADIAADLAQAARAELIDRAPFYWEVVAGSFIGRGRSYAQASAYAEAGIERYQVVAVRDEHTSACCRFLDGKTFSVRRALDHFATVDELEHPEDIKRVSPWVRQSGGRLYIRHATGRVVLADIVRDAVGTRDDVGEFRARLNDDQLGDLGIGFPPYHACCRSSTTPILS